jgi:hypothetical protein
VADDAPKAPAIARMIKARKLKLVGGEASVGTEPVAETPRESGHGHSQPSHVFPRGNRG